MQIPLIYLQYFDKMQPGDKIQVGDTTDPDQLITNAKLYIDNGGLLEFNGDWSVLRKLYPFKDIS